MRGLAFAGALGAFATLASAPASAAYLFDEDGDSADIVFNGFAGSPTQTVAGLSSNLRLTLISGAQTGVYRFSYALTNTSTTGGANSRVSGFAFNSTPDARLVATLGDFSRILLDGSYPNPIGDVEICLTGSNSCSGGGNSGAIHSDPATGIFSLTLDRAAPSVTLNDFFVRYQNLSGLNVSSALGQDVTTAVPEPGTWLMMILGLGAIGFAMRQQARITTRVRFA
ncbi:cistern family PEP-CTERM protein [Microcoleus sp. Pol14D5]